MRKAVLMMLLAVLSNSAVAGWVAIDDSNSFGDYTAYAETTTICKDGNMVKMWAMYDFNTAHIDTAGGKSYLSLKARNEYDCKEEQYRTLSYSFHSGNMGGGDVVFTDYKPADWQPTSRGSINEALRKYACGKQ